MGKQLFFPTPKIFVQEIRCDLYSSVRKMSDQAHSKFQERVIQAAEAALEHAGSVGLLEVFEQMRVLQPVHMQAWRKGNEHYRILLEHLQLGPEKFGKAVRHFREWVNQRGLEPVQASYTRRRPKGIEELQITPDRNLEWEAFYRTHYAPPNLTGKKKARLVEKLAKPPDLVVFEKVSEDGACKECGTELLRGSFLFMEKGHPLCLECADLDMLVYLPAGDAALSRRARKHSSLSAVVVRFSRARKRYERQGLLVTATALQQAEQECAADAPERQRARERSRVERQVEDQDFVEAFTKAIAEQFPGCPPAEARKIATHAGLRSSGRVGRSAAGRALDPMAVKLAVIAHVRHEHTNYDELLMQGTERLDARGLVRARIDEVLDHWSTKA
jgi:hypothetical protein